MRKVKVAGLAVVALLGLAGCNHDPSHAVSIGDFTVSDAQIDATADSYAAAAQEAGVDQAFVKIRESVAEYTIVKELCNRVARNKGITVPAADYDTTATSLGSTPDNAYVRLAAEGEGCVAALREHMSRPPTDAELHDTYNRYKAYAGDQASTFEDIKGALTQPDANGDTSLVDRYAQDLAVRDALVDAANRYNLQVSPRYQPVEYPLLLVANGALALVTLPLGQQGTGAVSPAPSPAVTPSA